ncbi:MAG: penicillin acylase family protein [Kiloniellales bacterium]|nr:penicillin acylase family protein [Kiloniellales bacterium]
MRTLNRTLLSVFLLVVSLTAQAETILPGLEAPVTVVRDSNGIPHIFAKNDHDVVFMQGWVHAEDRLFQMDLFRRQVAGTTAELLGKAALPSDVIFRTLGFERAARRSLDAHAPEFKDLLQAYSDGVNAFIDVAEATGLLPPEYGVLELSHVARWSPLDSLAIGKGLGVQTSVLGSEDIELTVTLETYRLAGAAAGFDGSKLFFEDLFRSAPFDPASTVPDAEQTKPILGVEAQIAALQRQVLQPREIGPRLGAKTLEQARGYLEKLRGLPRIPGLLQPDGRTAGGSNTWVVSGAHIRNGRPLLANDAHLTLNSPTIFHQVHLVAPGLDVIGRGLPGAPCVAIGHNRHLAWGFTNSRLDITDTYVEVIVEDKNSPSGLSTLYEGVPEPIIPLLESFSANEGGIVRPQFDQVVLIVPRRNNGPIITKPEPDPEIGKLTALSLQSIGFGPTRDPEGICDINRARNLAEFKSALQLVDFASQNVSYADSKGNIAYFVSGEVPLREDLQAAEPGDPVAPPFLIRQGTGGQEWIPEENPPPTQATAFAILPFEEMPQTENPISGVIVNSNNDQAGNSLDNDPLNDFRPGGGLYYLNWGGRNFSIRAGRTTRLLEEALDDDDRLGPADMIELQADVVMLDAQVLTPAILHAFDRASSPGAHPALAAFAADPRVAEAVERLEDWDHSTPTGIPEGYDARRDDDDDDDDEEWNDLDEDEIENSVAATIYSVWRREMAANTIDATLASVGLPPLVNVREERITALRYLLDTFEGNQGVGASGLDFFPGPSDADPATRRDIAILRSLADALDRLASDSFKAAFNNSLDQDDYRWGRLHRIVFANILGSVFNVPPGFGFFPPPLDDLDGIPTDGGFETVDVGSPAMNIETPGSDAFMFNLGPTGRFVAEFGRRKLKAVSSLPGGESAVPGSPFYLNLLEPWLLNQTYPLLVSPRKVRADAEKTQIFAPPAS